MSYIDALSDPLFKKSREGDTIFYPWAVLGKGYVIKPESRGESIRATVKWLNLGAVVVSLMCLQVLNWIYTAILIGVYYIFYATWTRRVTRGMRVSDEPLRLSESMDKTVASFGISYIVLMLVFSLIFVVIGVLMFFAEPQERLFAALAVIFFGAVATWNVFMLRAKLRQRRRQT